MTNFDKKFLNDSTLKEKFISSNAEEKKILLRKLYLNDITQATNTRILADDSQEDETCLINDDL
jgi:SOS response regulatory protein OraA/RecX